MSYKSNQQYCLVNWAKRSARLGDNRLAKKLGQISSTKQRKKSSTTNPKNKNPHFKKSPPTEEDFIKMTPAAYRYANASGA